MFPRLHTELVRAVAICELMLEGWVEPPPAEVGGGCDLSTLTQQVVSVVAETGSARADQLHELLCQRGPFRDVEPALFARMLRRLAAEDVIEQTLQGELILGLKGERLRKDKGFYAVFPTPETYALLHEGQHLGDITTVPRVGDHLAFGGRRWRAVLVDEEGRAVHVQPARGYKRATFDGARGEVHDAVVARMRRIYESREEPAYLDAEARSLIASARVVAAEAGITRRRIVDFGGGRCAALVWVGTRARLTLQAMLSVLGCEASDEEVALELPVAMSEAERLLDRCAYGAFDPVSLAGQLGPAAPSRKYNALLGPELVAESLGRAWVDVAGAKLAASGRDVGAAGHAGWPSRVATVRASVPFSSMRWAKVCLKL
jgi:ATP-dependent Lhr-like helicase